MFKHTIIILILSALGISSCKKFDIIKASKTITKDFTFKENKVVLYGAIVDISKSGIQNHGFCWALHPNPVINDSIQSLYERREIGDFSYTLANLKQGETYFARAFAVSGKDIIYGEVLSFNTNQAAIKIEIGIPQIKSSKQVNIEGKLNAIGSLNVEEYGHCYSKTANPSILDNRTLNNNLNNDTNFFSTLKDLEPNKQYFIRTYARLSPTLVIYSNEQTVTIPVIQISTDSFTLINSSTVNLIGAFSNLGADSIKEYGFVWSVTNPLPNYNDNRLQSPAPPRLGAFNNYLTEMQEGISYYFRAYATNGSSVVYGNPKIIHK